MFTLFMIMLKDELFCLLKNLVFISSFCSLFSSKNSFHFSEGGGGEGRGSVYSTLQGRKSSVILDGIRQGERRSRKYSFERDV